jgi:hypothetical protein
MGDAHEILKDPRYAPAWIAELMRQVTERCLYCEEAAARLGLPAASIEKDFWVCWTLRVLLGLPDWVRVESQQVGGVSAAWLEPLRPGCTETSTLSRFCQ